MEFIPAKLPLFVKKLFPKYTWNLPTEEKVLYLTFDDGPTPLITNWTLDMLDEYQAKATFFCIGNNIEKHPDIFQEILKRGHVVGNHSYNHPTGWKTTTEAYVENVKRTQDIIDFQLQKLDRTEKACSGGSKNNNQPEPRRQVRAGHQSTTNNLFRPPYGRITKAQGRRLMALDYKIIMWSILALDWSLKTTKEKCVKNVIKNVKRGSIVVFHDSEKASENMQYALPKVLEHFSKQGYTFKSLNPDVF
ncbi:Polysaccharide deacetylase [Xanthomarina gelatinilytica]|uniref:Polysaccharide deacetylase n=1 Tax=Xanthomarina gelatinilytica TaxID=1137281 RepID=M7MMU3_9FLAO|nr:polysaccharide deacetylase family protein [Xanthomarina gelatinilytica]EMQ96240.1 Polysaccharide deacetylase [Xanthomarina gelatinilytica]